MHQSSLDKMLAFKNEYLGRRQEEPLTIFDLGSQDINGTYKPIFNMPAWRYVGMDMSAGNNVDLVLSDPYRWRKIKSESVDVLVSGQAFEHIEYFWVTMLEIARVLKPGGLCCIIAPAGGHEHRYPVDCWRFYPDSFVALARFARLELLSVSTQWEPKNYLDGSDEWKDTMFVGRKPKLGGFMKVKECTRRILSACLSRLA